MAVVDRLMQLQAKYGYKHNKSFYLPSCIESDHDNLFMILEKFVGISGSALQLIKSYFSDRTQRVVIDSILSEYANLVCGVPQGSV